MWHPPHGSRHGPGRRENIRRWLCDRITENAGIEVQPVTLERWLKAWPCVLVFDGLDEVTAVSLLQRVVEEITGLVELADAIDADLLIVITTRPSGYNERILPEHSDQIDLDYLDAAEATAYGHHITNERFHDDSSLAKQVRRG